MVTCSRLRTAQALAWRQDTPDTDAAHRAWAEAHRQAGIRELADRIRITDAVAGHSRSIASTPTTATRPCVRSAGPSAPRPRTVLPEPSPPGRFRYRDRPGPGRGERVLPRVTTDPTLAPPNQHTGSPTTAAGRAAVVYCSCGWHADRLGPPVAVEARGHVPGEPDLEPGWLLVSELERARRLWRNSPS